MSWAHKDEWFCWQSMEKLDFPDFPKMFPLHYVKIPKKLYLRLKKAEEELMSIQREVTEIHRSQHHDK